MALSNGWLLIVARGCEHRIGRTDSLAKLANSAEVIACAVEEHVMFSGAECFMDGRSLWRVEHDAQQSRRDLSVIGEPPEDFDEVRARHEKAQDEEDRGSAEVDFIFEVPLDLARARVGFKHDELIPEIVDAGFDELRDSSVPSRAWWQFWK